MPRPYSQDLRDRVVASVRGGWSHRATAKRLDVSVATVVRWSQRFRATGSAAALAMGGHRPHRLADRRAWLLARIVQKPDLTLRAIRAERAAAGVKVSYGAVWAFFAREGITFKKLGGYEAIVTAACEACNSLIADPAPITSIGTRPSAIIAPS